MSERLQRVDIYTRNEEIEVMSVVTDVHDDKLPSEELIGKFSSPSKAITEIEKHQNILGGLRGIDALICVSAWLTAMVSAAQEMAYAGQRAEFEEANARLLASLSVAVISYVTTKKISSSIRLLDNAKTGLEEAEGTTGYPYSRNFDL